MKPRFLFYLSVLGMASLVSCAGENDSYKESGNFPPGQGANNTNSFNNPNNPNNPNQPPVEQEDDFEFSSPAVAGNRLFVANETLNAVAVIDSETLRIASVPVGFKPSIVAGSEANVFVLNAGSSTVTRIDPATLQTKTFQVMRRANDLVVSPDGTTAFSWFNSTQPAARVDGGGRAGTRANG